MDQARAGFGKLPCGQYRPSRCARACGQSLGIQRLASGRNRSRGSHQLPHGERAQPIETGVLGLQSADEQMAGEETAQSTEYCNGWAASRTWWQLDFSGSAALFASFLTARRAGLIDPM